MNAERRVPTFSSHRSRSSEASSSPSRSSRTFPFVDGNKRAGLAAAIAFLGLNDLWLEANKDELADLVTAVAEGGIGKPEIAVFVKEHAERFE